MANEPTSKTDDPAALAFSAVENALKESVFAPEESDSPEQPAKKQEDKPTVSVERRRTGEKIAARTSSVANDDQMPGARLLYSLQSRTSGAPLLVATALSAVWLALTGSIGYLRYTAEAATDGGATAFLTSSEFAALLALIGLPVVGFFTVAVLIRRSQELRIAAASMTQAAIRLTDPETTAADKVATVGQAVRREVNALGDGLERALSRAGELEVMVHNEVTSLERTYSENETRLRSLIQDLSDQRNEVIANSDRVRDAISGAHTAMINDLEQIGTTLGATITERGSSVRGKIEGATNEFQTLLDDRSGELVERIENRTADMVSMLDGRFERLDGLFGQRTDELTEVFNSRTDNFSTAVEARMESLVSEIDGRTEVVNAAITDRIGDLSAAIAAGRDTMISSLDAREEAMTDSLEALSGRIVNDIGGRAVHAEEVLTSLIDRLDESMSIRVNALESSFQSAIIEIGGVIEESSETARDALVGAGSEALSSLTTRADEVTVMLDSRLGAMDSVVSEKGERLITLLDRQTTGFDERATRLETSIEERTSGLGELIDARTQNIEQVFDGHLGGFVQNLEERTNLIDLALSEKTAELSAVLDTHTADFGQMIESRSDAFSSAIERTAGTVDKAIALRTTEFASTLESKTGEMSDAIDESTRALGDTLGTQTRTIAERIAERTQQLSEALSVRTERFSEALSSETTTLSEALDTRTRTLSDEIAARTVQISTAMEDQGNAFNSSVTETMTGVVNTLNAQSDKVSTLIDSKIDEINTNLGVGVDSAVLKLDDVESGLTARLSTVSGNIVESAREAALSVEHSVDHARDTIAEMVDNRLGTLPEAITARAEITADRLTDLNRTISTTISASMADLEASADQIEETLASRISQATATLSVDVEQTAARMDVAVRTALEQVKEASRHIEDLVEVKAVATAEQLDSKLGEMQRTVSDQSAVFAQMIDSQNERLNASLMNHGNLLKEALTASASESEQIMSSSTAKINDELTDALKRLNDSNLLLQRVLDTTTSNLADLESRVSVQTSSYSSTVKDALTATEEAGNLVTGHIAAFQNTVASMTGEFSELVNSLDTHTNNIDRAANNLTEAGNFSIDTLENRRGAMEALVQSFTARADEIDERMRTFAASISDTVSQTEQRLIAARQAMEDVLASTSSAVTHGLESFSVTADTESRRANQLLNETQQIMLREVQATLDEATHRFNETAAAMRTTAGQVGEELEATRTELQRGVIELPEETRASAAAMRRVVAEQIEALSELNAIVRSQSSTNDVSVRRPPRRSEEPTPAPAPRREDIRPVEARQPISHANNPPASTTDIASALENVLGAESQRKVSRPAPAQEAKAEQSGGWLRDVLRNASASQAGTAHQTNLSGLSGEIARSIETGALGEAWQRYQSGESDVFSRRIYTLSGQRVYDEVRRKLQRDPDFSTTANAYMEEFEQYLRRAAASTQAQSETRALLLSDRGKVYSMLAHASGRLN
jgi:hypothetical protein